MPQPGDCYIVGDNTTGDWTGQELSLAIYTASGWRFVSVTAGMTVLDRSTGCIAQFDGTQWSVGDVSAKQVTVDGVQVIGAQQPAIANHMSDGTINAILDAMRAHGLIAA